jgi:hypothetical protein
VNVANSVNQTYSVRYDVVSNDTLHYSKVSGREMTQAWTVPMIADE